MNLRGRIFYGAGELGPAMAGSTMVFFQLVFLTDVAGLAPSLAGSVLLLARIWDAINDPLIGMLSDRTRSAWGRRLPWMTAAALPFALFFVAFWLVPAPVASPDAQSAKFLYYLVVALAYSASVTAFGLPHTALTAEFSRDYDERSQLTAARMGFSLGGSVGGLLVALVVFRLLENAPPVFQYAVFGGCVGLIGFGAAAACVAGIWKIAPRGAAGSGVKPDEMRPGIRFREIRTVFQNRPFLMVCGIYLCSWLAMQFTAGVLPYYTREVLGLGDSTFQLLALTVQTVALLLLPLWLRVSYRSGKKPVYLLGMSAWLLAQTGLFFLEPGQAGAMFALAALAGIGISVCYLIPNAMLPDVIEWDELRTGKRREGLYYGLCVFLQKLALALGAFLVGQILSGAGYVAGTAGEAVKQPEAVVTAIRWAIGPVPAAVLAIGMILAAFFPISRAVHARMVKLLKRRSETRMGRVRRPRAKTG